MLLILLVFVVKEGRVVVLLHEWLWWLVHVHLGYLLGSLLSSRLLLLFLLPLRIDALELVEDVLVVEQRVRELVHEGLAGKEALDAALNHGHLEQLVDGGPLRRVALQHHSHNIGNSRAEVRG